MLEVKVIEAPSIRYTQDSQTPIAEMEVSFDGLRPDDNPGRIKVVGWGNLAQELQNRVQIGQRLLVEGRLRMNTVPRQDGTKEKRAEFTLSRMHSLSENPNQVKNQSDVSGPETTSPSSSQPKKRTETDSSMDENTEASSWNSAPLIPDTDDIPF